jgi:hypothetical protein
MATITGVPDAPCEASGTFAPRKDEVGVVCANLLWSVCGEEETNAEFKAETAA